MSSVIDTLHAATNAHDLDALAACFADDVASIHPTHPDRSFRGRDRVRANWAQIFAAVPDLRASIVSRVAAGDQTCVEWCFEGNGGRFEMRGVTLFRERDALLSEVRFFLEPVERATTIEQAVAGVGA